MDVPDERSATVPEFVSQIPTDWSRVSALCTKMSMLLEPFDEGYGYAPLYALDRANHDKRYPIEHEDSCWLGKNYADQPKVWKYGCDRGCVSRAAKVNGIAR